MLTGKSVRLRPVQRSDLSSFLSWFNDPEVTQYLSFYLPMTEMAEEKWIESRGTTSTDASFVIEAADTEVNKAIGIIGLTDIKPKDHHAGFGIAIGEKGYWSKGYGTEAARLIVNYGFQELNLHRINSSVIAFNQRSVRMHRKVGFKEEGRQREACFRTGKYHDLVVFGMLREEWKGL